MGPGLFTHFLNQISGLIKAAELTKLAWKIFKLKLSSIYVNQSFCPIVISKKKRNQFQNVSLYEKNSRF